MPDSEPEAVAAVIDAAAAGLEHVAGGGELAEPPSHRLAFRELGLAIGLHAAHRLAHATQSGVPDASSADLLDAFLARVLPRLPLAGRIERPWLQREHRRLLAWLEHRDINDVMLATGLAPDGYLGSA